MLLETQMESNKNFAAKEKMRGIVDTVLESLEKTKSLDAEIAVPERGCAQSDDWDGDDTRHPRKNTAWCFGSF